MKVAVKNLQNKEVGQIDLDDAIFGMSVRNDILHRMVHFQLNKRRAGTHDTKEIGEVSGTGKKPFKQKGTGNGRQGSLRSPQMRGGAVIFGPTPRSHATDLPKKVRALALKTALSAKAKAGKLIVLDQAVADTHKTKPMAEAMKALGLTSAVIVCGDEVDANFSRATDNLPRIDVLPSQGANVYDILRRDTLVLTKDAVANLTARLSK
ncbi:50S ribosomal protein L4 [Micavibrio aeruginosavorus]|uniref:Large ribosomal subunit protein uL4 n=1 Tax=Micavibrio aeruginosavorus (strain ARL-13) TaxID=856793 RepID=G2KQW2_MICAA|nr:50S ribosomal protein L4 [Micavibrio aeruginosavorus]AEP10440.1 50S ribosomal protein L4 [Micavibrio aeruginosavorus ARL-13]